MATYASKTEVSPDKSRAEIERTLTRYGASSFMYGWSGGQAILAFELKGRRIKYTINMPSRDKFRRTETGRMRTSQVATEQAYEQAIRQKWRAMALIIKAKLEAIEQGISTLEDEFLAGTMLPSGQTVGEWIQPQIKHVYETGNMPPLLPDGRG